MTCYCESDPADVFEVRLISKARKRHKCIECKEEIEVGEAYTYVSALYSGMGWSNAKVCEYCWHDWNYLASNRHCVELGGLSEAWEDHWFTVKPLKKS